MDRKANIVGQTQVDQQASKAEEESGLGRLQVEPMDTAIASIQPGGGLCMWLELAWGRWRRWYLKNFRRRYVARMKGLRLGEAGGCPFDPLDPRDVKFYRNQGGYHWASSDDPFAWRDRLPFVRAGLAELLILSGFCFALTAVLTFVYWPVAWIPAIAGLFVFWFFRDPTRISPTEPGQVVSPADGLVVSIDEIDNDEFIGGPAVVIGIFLSVFNVHINRSPASARVIGLSYHPGKFLNALRSASVRENEQLEVRLEENAAPHRRMIVRQIAGAIARRIVCWARPGDELARGEQFGMIKLGSRTELVLPRRPELVIEARRGQKVKAGTSLLARYLISEHVP